MFEEKTVDRISNPISSSIFNQIEQFLCHWKQKLEDYLFLFFLQAPKEKEQGKKCKKRRKRIAIFCPKSFEEKMLDPL
jgi:hypothetical protein